MAAAAVLEPEIAPKPAPASAVAIATPPLSRPTQMVAERNRSLARPEMMTNSAIRMNIGIVMIS